MGLMSSRGRAEPGAARIGPSRVGPHCSRARATHHGGALICLGCWQIPSAVCSICGDYKPCRGANTATPRCLNCYHRSRIAACAGCGRMHPIAGRDTNGNPVCQTCAQRREPCCRCGYFRACSECGSITRLHHFGRCAACAAPQLMQAPAVFWMRHVDRRRPRSVIRQGPTCNVCIEIWCRRSSRASPASDQSTFYGQTMMFPQSGEATSRFVLGSRTHTYPMSAAGL